MSAEIEDISDYGWVCDYCGCPITELGQECLALDEGVCEP